MQTMYLMTKMLSFSVVLMKKLPTFFILNFSFLLVMFAFIYFRKVLSDELTKLASLLNQMWFKQPTTNMSPAPVFPSFQ